MTPMENRLLPTRVLLISGFLGAGKTTLLKQVLSWQMDMAGTVVLVNEFGEVGVDGLLLEDSGSRVVELASGCICCTLQGDLKQSLTTILQEYQPRNLLIEASGVADPVTIAAVLTAPPLAADLRLEKIVTVLDVEYWEARDNFGQLFYNQLQTANLILLNKVDLAPPDAVSRYLHEIHAEIPGCQVIPTIRCQIDSDILWTSANATPWHSEVGPNADISSLAHSSNTPPHSPLFPIAATPPPFVTFTFKTSENMDEACFRAFVRQLPHNMFRLKGPVHFKTHTALINFVGGKADWLPWSQTQFPQTCLVFIGWESHQKTGNLSHQILEQLQRCVSD